MLLACLFYFGKYFFHKYLIFDTRIGQGKKNGFYLIKDEFFKKFDDPSLPLQKNGRPKSFSEKKPGPLCGICKTEGHRRQTCPENEK